MTFISESLVYVWLFAVGYCLGRLLVQVVLR